MTIFCFIEFHAEKRYMGGHTGIPLPLGKPIENLPHDKILFCEPYNGHKIELCSRTPIGIFVFYLRILSSVACSVCIETQVQRNILEKLLDNGTLSFVFVRIKILRLQTCGGGRKDKGETNSYAYRVRGQDKFALNKTAKQFLQDYSDTITIVFDK